jgi:vacuolar-type H+-ATPase subunit I/STV1
MDDVMAKSASLVSRNRKTVEVTESRLKDLTETVRSLSWVPDAMKSMADIEAKEKRIEVQSESLQDLIKLSQKGKREEQTIKELEPRINDARRVSNELEKAIELEEEIRELDSLIGRYQITEQSTACKIPELSGMDSTIKRINALESDLQTLCEMVEEYQAAEELECQSSDSLGKTEAKIEKWKALICPTCKQPFPQKQNTMLS